MTTYERVFPLLPRYRLIGLSFGAMHSARRGVGSDVAGSRPYTPGDDFDTIDWAASAKLSSAHGTDEFVVRESFAEEAPRVVALCDRRPEMALFPPGLPWLRKPDAVREAVQLIAGSALQARGFAGYLDLGDMEDPSPERRADAPFWHPPRSQGGLWEVCEERLLEPRFHAPADNLAKGFEHLFEVRRSVPPGTFLFVLSDFLAPPPDDVWARALERRWDVVPVVIQDPVWEQSFPDVSSLVVPLADPRTGAVSMVRLSRGEAEQRRAAHEERLERIVRQFEALGVDPVVIGSAEREDVFRAFVLWAEGRAYRRGLGTW